MKRIKLARRKQEIKRPIERERKKKVKQIEERKKKRTNAERINQLQTIVKQRN